MSNVKRTINTDKIVLCGILTAIVIILQLLASLFLRFGIFQVSLVLIPIVIGAAVCGTWASTWLGFVFGVVVLLNGDASFFLGLNAPATISVVLLKGILCGLLAGIVYWAVSKKNKTLAVILAAIVCPLTNTGIFFLGCLIFFMPQLEPYAVQMGFKDALSYVLLGMIGGNFLFELITNIVLAPAIMTIINFVEKKKTR